MIENNLLDEYDIFLLELDLTLPIEISILKANITEKQKNIIGELFVNGTIYLRWNNLNKQELAFTYLGKLEVYKIKYIEEINIFKDYLKNNNYEYDDRIIDNLLLSLDLSKEPHEILNMKNYNNYIINYEYKKEHIY